jgi:hypothetical protein
MQDYIITFAARDYGTMTYVMQGFRSKTEAIASASNAARIECGKGAKLKEARLYKGPGDHYVCKGW